ncbi:LSG1 [Cordylochernes scorpioides]|uniref:LSG1 n=1 Tax=Cordylochernes scorpioides TaxID=51811 RepID=A0ABY6KL24_9ARAC|nr:LSG1 [Cordylochernes scorpioides]
MWCAVARGHMTPRGPDRGWAAREILKKFLDGTLLHCKAPPEVDQDTYHPYPPPQTLQTSKKPADLSKMEKDFFLEVVQVPVASAHYKSLSMGMDGAPQPHKSWKKNMKRPKREKLRRIYKDD